MAAKGGFDIKLLGDKKLQRKLNKMDKRVAGKVLKQSMKSAMEPVRELAARRAPVRTGKLRKSIRTAVYSGRNFAGAVVRTGTRAQLGIEPGDSYYYPSALEYGTSKIRPRSYMRSSLYDRRKMVLAAVGREIKSRLK